MRRHPRFAGGGNIKTPILIALADRKIAISIGFHAARVSFIALHPKSRRDKDILSIGFAILSIAGAGGAWEYQSSFNFQVVYFWPFQKHAYALWPAGGKRGLLAG